MLSLVIDTRITALFTSQQKKKKKEKTIKAVSEVHTVT